MSLSGTGLFTIAGSGLLTEAWCRLLNRDLAFVALGGSVVIQCGSIHVVNRIPLRGDGRSCVYAILGLCNGITGPLTGVCLCG